MDNAWLGVVGALGGVLVGATAEAIRATWAFRREKIWASLGEQRLHLEAIYETLEELRDSYGQGVGGVMFAVTQGKMREGASDMKAPWARLRMLVHLYAPWLVKELGEVERTGPLLGAAMGEGIMHQSGDKRRDGDLLGKVLRANSSFSEAVDLMRDAIVEGSRRLDVEAASLVRVKPVRDNQHLAGSRQ
jgi:hypothetical protein